MNTPIWDEMAEEIHARLRNLRIGMEDLPPVTTTEDFRTYSETQAISDYLQQRMNGAETVPFPVGVIFDSSPGLVECQEAALRI